MHKKQIVHTNEAPLAIGPYSQAIKTDSLIFTSGQLPTDPKSGEVVQGGITKQTEQVLENLRAVLEAGGSCLESVLKTTVFLKDLADFAVVNEIYARFFKDKYPARSCVQVSRLPKDVCVEIEAVAKVDVIANVVE